MGNASLPVSWQLRWTREPARDALSVMMSALVVKAASVSMAYREHGLAAWGMSAQPAEIVLPEIPVLDDVWCLYMLAASARGEQPNVGWDAMSHYVEDVRRGFWPDRVAPERAVQAVFSAIVHEHLAGATPARDEFLADALELCRHVDAKLAAGAELLASDVTDAPKLQRYRAALASDHKLYDEDVARGHRWWAHIPASQADGRERRVPLLVLQAPVARQFKMWARSDARAPGGHGYPLLLVDVGKGEIILSADPTARLKIGWLAAGLDKLEGSEARWYDGARHGQTLVAAPKGGTKLSLDEVVAYLRRELKLGRVWNHRAIRNASIAGGAVAVIGVSVFVIANAMKSADPGPGIAKANRDALYLVNLPGDGICTAFAISAHELATAKHCVFAHRGMSVVRNGSSEKPRVVTRSYVHKSLDVGVLVVGDALPAVVSLGTRDDLFDAQGAKIYVFGFPQEVSNRKRPEALIDETTVSKPPNEDALAHTGATSGGSSGSPIFNAAGRVIAVHSGVKGDDFGGATRFAGAVPVHRLEQLRADKTVQAEPQQ